MAKRAIRKVQEESQRFSDTDSEEWDSPSVPGTSASANSPDDSFSCRPRCEEESSVPMQKNDSDSEESVWDTLDADPVVLSSESDYDSEESHFPDDLVCLINKHQAKHSFVDDLLKLLRKNGHPDLPATARTLLKTQRHVMTQEKSGMEYAYLDFKDSLSRNLNKYPEDVIQNIDNVEISLNIDGLPLFSSTSTCLWPVLCAIMLEPIIVFPVAITCGKSKPTNLEFLMETIADLDEILRNGIQVNGIILGVSLRCIVCDAPARAMVRATKQYSGYYGCERCSQKGEWHGRITYQETDHLFLRTNQAFRDQIQTEHHKGISPFMDLPVDMIKSFPLDYMHQACLGVMRRLLLLWIRGSKRTKMSALQISQVSTKLIQLQVSIPDCFARKPRSLDEIERWKATEYRLFLLYIGKLILKGVLTNELYKHFMTLSVAMCILISPKLAQIHREYAKDLLQYFVQRGRELYGREFLVYNVHAMLHIADDAQQFECLDKCSAFPFENYLQKMKKMVRSGKNALAQVIRRVSELDQQVQQRKDHNIKKELKFQRPNNCYVLEDDACCEAIALSNEEDDQGKKKVLCRVYTRVDPAFLEPCSSQLIGVHRVHVERSRMRLLSPAALKSRAILISSNEGREAVCLAVLHDF